MLNYDEFLAESESSGNLKSGIYDIKYGYPNKIVGNIKTGDKVIVITLAIDFKEPSKYESISYNVSQEDFIEILKAFASHTHQDVSSGDDKSGVTYHSLSGTVSVWDKKASNWGKEFPAYALDKIVKDNKGNL